MTDTPAFPPLHVYALAHRCPQCGAQPGIPCEAPRKEARVDNHADTRARTGRPQTQWNPAQLIHARRQDAGYRHYERDEAKAPQPEDREPGRRYDTLGDLR